MKLLLISLALLAVPTAGLLAFANYRWGRGTAELVTRLAGARGCMNAFDQHVRERLGTGLPPRCRASAVIVVEECLALTSERSTRVLVVRRVREPTFTLAFTDGIS